MSSYNTNTYAADETKVHYMYLSPRVSQGHKAKGVRQAREEDQDLLVVEDIMPRMHSQWLAQLDPEGRGEAQVQKAPLELLELQGHREMM